MQLFTKEEELDGDERPVSVRPTHEIKINWKQAQLIYREISHYNEIEFVIGSNCRDVQYSLGSLVKFAPYMHEFVDWSNNYLLM